MFSNALLDLYWHVNFSHVHNIHSAKCQDHKDIKVSPEGNDKSMAGGKGKVVDKGKWVSKGKGGLEGQGVDKYSKPKKPTQAPTWTSPHKTPTQDPESTDLDTDHIIEHEDEFDDNGSEASTNLSVSGSKKRQCVGIHFEEISIDNMKRIASWLEGMSVFYDQNYKNT